jgi:hypothetical protein
MATLVPETVLRNSLGSYQPTTTGFTQVQNLKNVLQELVSHEPVMCLAIGNGRVLWKENLAAKMLRTIDTTLRSNAISTEPSNRHMCLKTLQTSSVGRSDIPLAAFPRDMQPFETYASASWYSGWCCTQRFIEIKLSS